MIEIKSERLAPAEYVGFLKRTDLGSQYPRERFEERIPKLLENASVSLAARNEAGLLVGALLGLTDFAYWLYVTDLGVDRDYERRGIGRAVIAAAEELARARGARSLGIHTTQDNLAAQGLYTACGYALTEIGPCTTADGVERIGYTFCKNL